MSEDESTRVAEPHEGKEMHKAVSVFHLVCISFFYVCAGPFGQGEAIAAGGAKWTFVFTLLIPVIFSAPLALISSEQASRLPMCGGCVEWGFILGKIVGYINTYVRTLCSIFDNAIYPVMVCDYLDGLVPGMDNVGYRTIVVLLSNIIVLGINIAGLETVGVTSFILTFIIITPFILFFAFGASEMTADKVFADKPEEYGEVDWALLLSTLIWQYCGFDTIAAISEETKNPKRTFPLALGITIFIVTCVYLLPTVSGLSVEPDLDAWESGAFSDIAWLLPHCGSGWLSYWISVAGVVSALSLLNIAVLCTGRETYAGALLDAFPFSKYLGKLNNNMKGEPLPIVSLVVMAVFTIPFSFFDFTMLVEWSGLLTVIQQLIQIASFIACRFPNWVRRMKRERAIISARVEKVELSSIDASRDVSKADQESLEEDAKRIDLPEEDDGIEDLSDKFVIPGGWIGVTIVLVPITAVSIFLCVVSGWMSLVISVAMVVAMFILKGIEIGVYYLIHMCKRKRARARRERRSELSNSSRTSEAMP
ncbi:putative Amino acid permease [Tritrichomonas foetus]|uniref:Amino acid permease n=1 Tax=Tritrichomonas foetus TaxID=1144522 RepID=A0A1J4KAV9_9EUKA|nr:putative Amino acid permease [Tritrichomonas foetus]|eukprot:OHT08032.1 putative Amino acid permease [Tritrichomonas foetus]